MKKKLVCLLLAAAMVLGLVACGRSDGTVVVKYSVTFTNSGTQADGAVRLGEIIEECSDGRLEMQFYPSSQLGDKNATLESMQMGTIEMTECAATDLSSYNDMWSVFAIPYLWDSGSQACATVMDPAVQEILEADMEENGFKIIAWTDIGSRSIVNTKRTVMEPADLKGLKIRCMQDTLLANSITAMGAIATPMASSDVYTGMQQGTIDGAEHTPAGVASFGWDELAKYYSLTEQFTIPDPVFVSKRWFDKLSEENQASLLEAGKKFSDEWNTTIWPNANEQGMKDLEAAGVEIVEPDKQAFIDAVQPVVDDFLANASDSQKALYDLLIATRDKYK